MILTARNHLQIRFGPRRGHFLVLRSVNGLFSGEFECSIVHSVTGNTIEKRPDCWSTESLVGVNDVFGLKG